MIEFHMNRFFVYCCNAPKLKIFYYETWRNISKIFSNSASSSPISLRGNMSNCHKLFQVVKTQNLIIIFKMDINSLKFMKIWVRLKYFQNNVLILNNSDKNSNIDFKLKVYYQNFPYKISLVWKDNHAPSHYFYIIVV